MTGAVFVSKLEGVEPLLSFIYETGLKQSLRFFDYG